MSTKKTNKAKRAGKPTQAKPSPWVSSRNDCSSLLLDCRGLLQTSTKISAILRDPAITVDLSQPEVDSLCVDARTAVGLLTQFDASISEVEETLADVITANKKRQGEVAFIEVFSSVDRLMSNYNDLILPAVDKVLTVADTVDARRKEKANV